METGLTSLNPNSITRKLSIVAALLILNSIVWQVVYVNYGRVHGLVDFFNVDREQNVPTGFSVFILLFAACLLIVIALIERSLNKAMTRYWFLLSIGFGLMALDEGWSCHEILISPLRHLLGDKDVGIFFFSWVVVAIPGVAFLAMFFWRFLFLLPGKTRNSFMLAAAVYLFGAVGFELIGGRYAEKFGDTGIVYNTFVTLEESLEMAGIILFIRALLTYIAANYALVTAKYDDLNEIRKQLSSEPEDTLELGIEKSSIA